MGCGSLPSDTALHPRRIWAAGVTLVELLVALAILGVMAGLAGMAWRPAPPTTPASEAEATIRAARRSALATGRRVLVTVRVGGQAVSVAALPDGQVIGAGVLGADRLSGASTPHSGSAP